MKLLKRLGIAVIAIILLFVIAGFAASRIVNKAFVEQQLTQATGRKLTIDGDLSPIISLSPSIRAEKVSFGNASWGSRPELAKIGKFDIQMKLLPLLGGEVIVSKLDIDGADILLEKKGDTWNFSLDEQAQKVQQKNNEVKNQGDKKQMSFDVSSLSITNSVLSVKQGGAPTVISIKSLKFAPRQDKMGLDFEGDANGTPLKLSIDTSPLSQLASAKKIDLNSIKFESNNIKLTGNASVDLNGKKPYVKADLESDQLDLSSTAKTKSAAAPESESKSASSSSSSENNKLPLAGLDSVDADFHINIATLKSGDIVVQQISAPVQIKDGVLTANPLKANFAGGTITSSLRAAQTGAAINLAGRGLSMEKILSETAGITDFKNGETTVDVNLSGTGDSVAALKNSLQGTSKINMQKGEYLGRIPTGSVAELSSLLTGGGSSKNTPVNCMVANINWSNGIGTFQAFSVDSQYAALTGTGTIRLSDSSLDLVITPQAKSTGLMNLAVPVAVHGPFNDLSYYPEPKAAVENLSKTLLMGLGVSKNKGSSETAGCGANDVGNNIVAPGTAPANNQAAIQSQPQTPAQKIDHKINKKLGKIFGN